MGYSKKTNKPADNGGKAAANVPLSRRAFRVRPVAIAAIVAILAAVAFLVVRRGTGSGERGMVDKDKKVQRQRPARPTQLPSTNRTAKANAGNNAEKPEKQPFVKRPGAMQLPDGKVLTFPAPKEGEVRKVYAYGHMYECDSKGNFRDVTPRKLFHTAFEGNFLGLAVEDKPFIPAFLKGLDQDEVKKILTKNYEPIGDETEEEWTQLKAYDEMRCAALQYMEEGGTFDDFVDYFANQVKKERQTQAMCLREVMTLYKAGKIAEAKEMAQAAEALKEKEGLKPLKLPPHVREAFDKL